MARAFVASAPSPYTVSVGNATRPPALRQRTASATASGVTVMTRVDGSAVTSYLISLRPSGALVIRPASCRSVAQPGRAPRSGRGGRRFKYCHSDQTTPGGPDFPQLSTSPHKSEQARVHKGVHGRELRMVRLRQRADGAYYARK